MTYHITQFTKQNLDNKSDGYLFMLWVMSKHWEDDDGRLSDKIKEEIEVLGLNLLKVNFQKRAVKYRKILEIIDPPIEQDTTDLIPLKSLQACNFSGFGSLGADDKGTNIIFASNKNIFYAPNGGGKTSLCEAIEFAITGQIKEADRRKTKAVDYIKRIGCDNPEVKLLLEDDTECTLNPRLSACFLDKNRLQEFSLLGSRDTKVAEKDVLAALFGLEEIESLISRFVLPQSFNLESLKIHKSEYNIKELDSTNVFNRAAKREQCKIIDESKENVCKLLLLDNYKVESVRGRYNLKKRFIQFIKNKKSAVENSAEPKNIAINRLKAFVRKASFDNEHYIDLAKQLDENSRSLNFEAIFNALKQLDNETNELCPACLTPLSEVVENPFERAREELLSLSFLSELKSALEEEEEIINRNVLFISELINSSKENHGNHSPFSIINELIKLEEQYDNIGTFEEKIAFVNNTIDLINNNEVCISDYIATIDTKFVELVENAKAIDNLESKLNKNTQLVTNVEVSFSKIKDARKRLQEIDEELASYKEEKKKLLSSKKIEDQFNNIIEEVDKEYKQLYKDLMTYKLGIEKEKIEGIETKATEYYQAINYHDEAHERISKIEFKPRSTGYRINVFDNNQQPIDAFCTLSEGHLRALGLALLLSVAEKYKYPFIVFDDVVNAIDSDHRANIIELFNRDPYLSSIQQIITTHDRLFWERYCYSCGIPNDELSNSRVLQYSNEGIVLIEYSADFREKIKVALNVYDLRQALIYCRIWLETMVIEFCVNHRREIKAKFSNRQLKTGNLLEVILESTYEQIEPVIAWDTSHLDLIKKDLVNWKGQNQEHHAFDEGGLNFVHSKTSTEIQVIYDALFMLECQLEPEKQNASIVKEINDIEKKLATVECLLGNDDFVEKAPEGIVTLKRNQKVQYQEFLANTQPKLDYLHTCIQEQESYFNSAS